MNTQKRLSSIHDLTRGEREYLRKQNISEREFDRMNPRSQHEWKGECKDEAYRDMNNFEKHVKTNN